jgi:hypothetical protein
VSEQGLDGEDGEGLAALHLRHRIAEVQGIL